MDWLFGSKQSKAEAPKKAIMNLRQTRDTLKKREKHLQTKIDEYLATAKKSVNNKQVALSALKRKKVAEGDLDRVQGQIDALDAQLTALESAHLNQETLKSMQQGANAMKQIHGNMDIDKVEDTMEMIRDQLNQSEEIADTISRPLGPEIDESELDDELAALQEEDMKATMINVGRAPVGNLPTTSAPAAAEQEEEDSEDEELRKLQAEMAM